jgi:hypothetical protein
VKNLTKEYPITLAPKDKKSSESEEGNFCLFCESIISEEYAHDEYFCMILNRAEHE